MSRNERPPIPPTNPSGEDDVMDELLGEGKTSGSRQRAGAKGSTHHGGGAGGEDSSGDRSADDTKATDAPEPAPVATRPRMTVYIAQEVQDAARAAVYWTNNRPGGYDNLSNLLEDALMDKVHQLEAELNEGNSFPPMPQGRRLRRGRPIGRQ